MSKIGLEMRHVSYQLGNKTLVAELDIELRPGELVGLIGPNGAGKSTALKLISGELKPHQGEVLLHGDNLHQIKSQLLALHRSVMAQSVQVVFDFTVREIIEMGWVQGAQLSASKLFDAIQEIVGICELNHLLDRRFNSLSGGEQQRVQFARNLLQIWRPPSEQEKPRYLLLDEPTASMDLRHELMLLEQLASIKQQNVGVLIVMHDLNLAARFMDRVLLMQQGRLVQAGEPAEVFQAELLTDVYRTPIQVEQHSSLERLVIHT